MFVLSLATSCDAVDGFESSVSNGPSESSTCLANMIVDPPFVSITSRDSFTVNPARENHVDISKPVSMRSNDDLYNQKRQKIKDVTE
jgi:hypothetical protein